MKTFKEFVNEDIQDVVEFREREVKLFGSLASYRFIIKKILGDNNKLVKKYIKYYGEIQKINEKINDVIKGK